MNTNLQNLFDKSNLSYSDKYEINQIFELLPLDKKQNILNNFDVLAFNLATIKKEENLEKRILVWDVFTDVKNLYKKYK